MRLAILSAMIVLGACSSANGERGQSGQNGDHEQGGARSAATQRNFPVGPFQAVALEGSHDVVVTVGGEPAVRAEGDAEALDRLDIRVEGDTLHVGQKRGSWIGGHRGRVTVYVTTPTLSKAALEGSGDLRIDRVQADDFEARLAGSGDIEIGTMQAARAKFSIAGSGDIQASGTSEEAQIDIAGSGDVDLDGLTTRRARVSVAGSGNISLQASEAVEGSLMGSGDLNVRGSARCAVSKMGSGDIRCGA